MPKKSYGKNGRTCRVTFELPADLQAEAASVVGDFNDWKPDATPMSKRKDGRFSVTVSLEADQSYRYRFVVNGEKWENDWEAESYVRNDYGSEDSMITV